MVTLLWRSWTPRVSSSLIGAGAMLQLAFLAAMLRFAMDLVSQLADFVGFSIKVFCAMPWRAWEGAPLASEVAAPECWSGGGEGCPS